MVCVPCEQPWVAGCVTISPSCLSAGAAGGGDPGVAQITGQPDITQASEAQLTSQSGKAAAANTTRPRVFLDIAPFGDDAGGRLEFELYSDIVPATAQNFRELCTGEHGLGSLGKPLHYKGAAYNGCDKIIVASDVPPYANVCQRL